MTPSPLLHFVFESLAYLVGMRYFTLLNRSRAQGLTRKDQDYLWVLVGAIAGAALGSKLGFWFERPDAFVARLSDPLQLLGGKSVLAGFLGGVLGVELAKWCNGIQGSTGDHFVLPIMVGLMIGRVGCFFGGLGDATYGLATSLPWAVDFGDGIPRHPTQLYEIIFIGCLFPLIYRINGKLARSGDSFKLFMAAYLLWRFAVEFLKPREYLYFSTLSGIQLTALAGLLYYGPHLVRIGGSLCQRR